MQRFGVKGLEPSKGLAYSLISIKMQKYICCDSRYLYFSIFNGYDQMLGKDTKQKRMTCES